VKKIGRKQSKLLPYITIKKQKRSLSTTAGMTEMMKDTEDNITSVSEILLQKQYIKLYCFPCNLSVTKKKSSMGFLLMRFPNICEF